jgi:hypothetical protein
MYPARSVRQRELRRPVFAVVSAPGHRYQQAGHELDVVVVTFLATDDEFAAGGPSFLRGRHVGPVPEDGEALIHLDSGGLSLRWVNVDDIVDITVVGRH